MNTPSGHRDSQGDAWIWDEPGAGSSGRRPPWGPVLATICALGLAGVAIGLLLLSGDDNARHGTAGRSSTSTATNDRTPAQSGSSAAAPSPTWTAGSNDGTTVELLAWAARDSRWFAKAISPENTTLKEGESIPLLLRLEGAVPGRLYALNLRYRCATNKGAALDFLVAPAEGDAQAILTEPGPARARPDSAIAIPDDQTIPFDDVSARRFLLWGGTFQSSPQGPVPPSPCIDTKEFVLAIVAQQRSVFLIWAAHLASTQNWGEGRAAASQDKAIIVQVTVTGTIDSTVEIAPGVVKP